MATTLDIASLLMQRRQPTVFPSAEDTEDSWWTEGITPGGTKAPTTSTTAPSNLHQYIIESAKMRNLDPTKALAMF